MLMYMVLMAFCQSVFSVSLISSMLVREPSQRATLQQIIDHPWLMFGEVASIPLRPLISREHLSEDDHTYIVQRMVSGEIALRDDVIRFVEAGWDAFLFVSFVFAK